MKNTKQPGTVSEAKVAAALLQKGKTVLVPMGDGERYDLVFTQIVLPFYIPNAWASSIIEVTLARSLLTSSMYSFRRTKVNPR